ncbi:MAG: Lrp/AsnC family transcriptional regulator [Methanomassiliicoccales archaeon]
MERLDLDILNLMMKDAKLTYEEMSERLERSVSTIRDRIKMMENQGIILGYSAIIDESRMGISIDALLAADLDKQESGEVVATLLSFENVREIICLTGEKRLLLRIKARDGKELLNFLDRNIRPMRLKGLELMLVLEPIVRFPGIKNKAPP